MSLVPEFPLIVVPEDWSDLMLIAATIGLEAEGEPDEGKVGVGAVVMNRHRHWHLTIHQVILGPEGSAWADGKPYEPFSCWNDEYRPMADARLTTARGPAWERCWWAASGVLWQFLPDPTGGALFYLNVAMTKRLRAGGTLPDWAADPANKKQVNASKVRAILGHHTFLV